jgi:hypothetical protein
MNWVVIFYTGKKIYEVNPYSCSDIFVLSQTLYNLQHLGYHKQNYRIHQVKNNNLHQIHWATHKC